MQKIVNHKHFSTAKQMCVKPSYWSIMNGESQVRIRVQETKV